MAPKPTILSVCDSCGINFYRYKHQLKNNTCCCSRKCAASLRKAIPSISCSVCGKLFHRKQFHVKGLINKDNITCSRSCSYESRKITYKGALNHQYGLKGELNFSHKSDISLTRYGYINLRSVCHPLRDKSDFVMAHRLIIEEHLRVSGDLSLLEKIDDYYVLPKKYEVHHKDEIKTNNIASNLEVMTKSDHLTLHNLDKIKTRERDNLGRLMPTGKTTVKMYKKHRFDAGQDVISNEEIIINPRDSAVIGTGMNIDVPEGYVGLLWSRSGLSVKYKIEVGAGCIDHGYTGEVKVHLYNHSDDAYKVNKGDRIAQLLTLPIDVSEYEVVEELDATDRGDGGFGSTGTS